MRDRALSMLEAVRIRDPRRVLALYPHELSGGMGQRVMIAMMLAGSPSLVIADEPTSALDVTIRGQILDILNERVEAEGAALVLISHDLAVVAHPCERVAVMTEGRIVKTLAVEALRRQAATQPCARQLIAASRGGGAVAPLPASQGI